ncbi:MAG: hypothetical protein NC301_00015 [Bacteroides sp.]|nr:hypothetical protein [Bacteroides sp.]MCM1379294.1 hypothetical protein [Bacteroides sp.]MCM1445047.1 hypothetical protein [Prevotella sp.]
MAIAVAAILRAGHFSPNNVGRDAAILNDVAAELRRKGIAVNIYSEEQFIAHGIGSEQIVMAMTRDSRSTTRLLALENQGRIVVNSGHAITHCIRSNMVKIFERAEIPQPPTLLVSTNEDVRSSLKEAGFGACWVKRADCQTIHKEDVVRVRHIEEAQELLSEFFIRGIEKATVAQHLDGLYAKFYGVDSVGFFHFFFTAKEPDEGVFNAPKFRHVCEDAARALGVTVYGGDAVVNPKTGEFHIVSFNDWPGFAPCRKEATKAITKFVATHARKLLRK